MQGMSFYKFYDKIQIFVFENKYFGAKKPLAVDMHNEYFRTMNCSLNRYWYLCISQLENMHSQL